MNNVSLIGRITKDVELRTTESGIAAVSIFIAIDNGKDKEGNDRPADFPKIYVYEKQAENVNKYCHKGSLVGVTGRIKTRSWDKDDGTKGYETYVVANRVQFLDTKQSNSAPIPEPEYTTSVNEKNETEDPYADMGDEIQLDESDLPFDFN